MVKRTESKSFEQFEGTVEDIKVESSNLPDDVSEQYHLFIKAHDQEIGGKTGLIHEWIRISPTATPSSVPEGCVMDRYLQQLEILFPEVKDKEFHSEAFLLLKDKKCLFKKLKLGKSFEEHKAKDYWTPVKVL